MKKGLVIVLSLIMNIFVFAQDKDITIKLSNKEVLSEIIDLNDNGFLLATAQVTNANPRHPNYLELDKTIKYYSPSLELNWKVDLPIPETARGTKTQHLISTKDAETIYQIYSKGLKTLIITLVKKGKIINTKQITENIKIKYIQNIFCDNNNLYMLCTKNNRQYELSKVDEKLILHTFSGTDFTYSNSEIELPKIENPKKTSFWHYVGHKNQVIYLKSRMETDDKYIYKLVSVNDKGIVLNNVKVELPIDNKYLASSTNIKNFAGTINKSSDFYDNGFFIKTKGNLYLSDDCNYFYIYGLYSNNKKKQKPLTGFFIKKYNIDGTKLFDIDSKLPPKLKNDNEFCNAIYTFERLTILKAEANSITFQMITANSLIYTYIYNQKGELLKENYLYLGEKMHVLDVRYYYAPSIKHKILDLDNNLAPTKEDASIKYLKSLKKQKREKQVRLYYLPSSENEVLINFNPALLKADRKINILSFKRNIE